jgi:N-terminal helicase PWI domain
MHFGFNVKYPLPLPLFPTSFCFDDYYISSFESDAETAQSMAEKVLSILQSSDSRYIENELVPLLDYERFDFIKQLVRNRKKITYCTRLAKAQTEEEKKQIEAEMQVVKRGKNEMVKMNTNMFR